MKKLVAVFVFFLAMVDGPAAADCRVRQRVVVQVQVQAVALVATLPLAVPAYSVSVDPVAYALLEEVRAIRKELAGLRGGAAGPADLKALVTADCAKCHSEAKAADHGGEFVLVEANGSLAVLSLPERRRIAELVEKGTMPPKAPLSDARKAEFRAAMKAKASP